MATERKAELLGVERKNVNEFDELNVAADKLHAATNRLNAKMDEMRDCLGISKAPQTCGRKPSQFQRIVRWLRPIVCRHQFRLGDQSLTGIPEPEMPSAHASYAACLEWCQMRDKHPSHTKRVQWPCAKCGKVFYAHCGLDVLSRYGTIQPPNDQALPR